MAAFTRFYQKKQKQKNKTVCVISNLAVLLLGIHSKEIMKIQYGIVITQWSYRPHLNPDSTTNLLCGLEEVS